MSKLKPALVGGTVSFLLGLLTSFATNFLPLSAARLAGCLNCVWLLAGGAVAVYLYVSRSPTPVRSEQGAAVGALAGVVGGLINFLFVIGSYLLRPAQVEAIFAQLEDAFRQAGAEPPTWLFGLPLILLIGCLGIVLNTLFGALGGLIGVPLFEKRRGGAPPPQGPPPPPDFSATPGGGYRAGG